MDWSHRLIAKSCGAGGETGGRPLADILADLEGGA